MERICLLVDINGQGLDQEWSEKTADIVYALKLTLVTADEVGPMIETGSVVAMVIFADSSQQIILDCLNQFRKFVGALPAFQAIVAADPDPFFMSEVFEYGVEQFINPEVWPQQVAALTERVASVVEDKDSIEAKTLRLNWSIAYGDQGQILQSKEALNEAAEYDFVAAYAKANALQAVGQFGEAVEAYRASHRLNKTFRQSSSGLGESLLVLGKVDEAIEILERLERQNHRNVDRKANLATAYLEKGDKAKAEALLKEAEEIAPGHARIAEAKAEILLAEGKVGEAFKMMDTLRDVGPLFAAKLNEMGIKLSQQGKGKSAIALYKKAHKVVRHELRYKISLNAGLACYRMAEYEVALQYLARCEKEFGGTYEKIEKIKLAIKKAMAKPQSRQAS